MNNLTITAFFLLAFLSTFAQQSPMKTNYLKEVESLNKKIEGDPENILLYYQRAMVYDALNDFAAANRDFSVAAELFFKKPSKKFLPEATQSCYYLADDFYYRNSDRDNAMKYVDKGLSIAPEDKSMQIIEAAVLGAYPEKREDAKKKFERLIKKYPDDEKLCFHYAKFIEHEDLDKAVQYFKKVVSLNPQNTDALFALGSYFTNKANQEYKANGDPGVILKDTETGVSYFEKVYQLHPEDTEVIEILIQFYGYLKRTQDVEKMEKKLAALKP